MQEETNLLIDYPKTKRNVDQRGATKTKEDQEIARKFDKEFFDGDRKHGYGGFYYSPRFWQPVIPYFIKKYNLSSKSAILDVGCGKGFMLYDFSTLIPGINLKGIDISQYAIENAKEEMKPFLEVGDAKKISFEDKSFDLVISINTVHNLDKDELIQSLLEIERVGKNSYIVVDAYRNEKEKELINFWNLTAKTVLHVDEWKKLFKEVGYTGDYYWFIP